MVVGGNRCLSVACWANRDGNGELGGGVVEWKYSCKAGCCFVVFFWFCRGAWQLYLVAAFVGSWSGWWWLVKQ